MTNTLFYGDNLPVLRDHVPDASVDLVTRGLHRHVKEVTDGGFPGRQSL